MNTFIRKEIVRPLSAVSGKVVRRIGRELFDLNGRGDIFFLNHPYNTASVRILSGASKTQLLGSPQDAHALRHSLPNSAALSAMSPC